MTQADVEAWKELLKQTNYNLQAPGAVPQVDFTRRMIIAAFQGRQPSGHGQFNIRVGDVVDEGQTIKVLVNEFLPGRFCAQTAAETSPCDIVEVEKSTKKVLFEVKENTLDCK